MLGFGEVGRPQTGLDEVQVSANLFAAFLDSLCTERSKDAALSL
jgi:hypothetical protein